MRTRLTENDITRIVRKTLMEQEVRGIESAFAGTDYADDLPEACKPSVDKPESETFTTCLEHFNKIAEALKNLMKEKGIQ
jgi:hypothetical protein